MSAAMTMGAVCVGEKTVENGDLSGTWYRYLIFQDGKKIGKLCHFPKMFEPWDAYLQIVNDFELRGSGTTPMEAIKDALDGGARKLVAASQEAWRMMNRDNRDLFEAVQGIE